MNQIAKVEASSIHRPTPMHEASRSALAKLVGATRPEGNGKYSISQAASLSDDLRAGLGRRRAAIDGWHLPASRPVLESILSLVIGIMKAAPEAEADAFMRRQGYILALDGLPAYAAEDACKAALAGKIGNPGFLPQPGELRAYARRLMEPLLRERADVSRVLDASIEAPPKQTPKDRAAMLERVRASVRRVHEGAAQPMRYERQQMTEEDRRFATQKGGPNYRGGERKRLDAQAALDAMPYRDTPCQLSDEAIEKFHQGNETTRFNTGRTTGKTWPPRDLEDTSVDEHHPTYNCHMSDDNDRGGNPYDR